MKMKKLVNGLVLLYEKNTVSHRDAFHINVLTGSALETNKEKGINHLVEHLMFKSSHKRTTQEISKELEQQGALINACTSYDNVCFFFECLPNKIDKCAEIYADMIFNKNINQEEFDKEKSVVCQEIAMYEDDFESTNEVNYYREFLKMDDVAGSIKSVKAITLDQVNEFIDARYTPDNMVISVCSKLSFSKIVKIVKKYFGIEKTQPHLNLRNEWNKYRDSIFKFDINTRRNGMYKQKKDTAQVQVMHTYYLKGLKPNPLLVDVLEKVLSAGLSAVLFREVREKYGVCYGIQAEAVTFNPIEFNKKLPQLLVIKSSTEKKHLKQYLEAVDNVISNIDTIITDTDIERAINISNTAGLKAREIADYNFFFYCNPEQHYKNINVAKEAKYIKKKEIATLLVKTDAKLLKVADKDITILGNI